MVKIFTSSSRREGAARRWKVPACYLPSLRRGNTSQGTGFCSGAVGFGSVPPSRPRTAVYPLKTPSVASGAFARGSQELGQRYCIWLSPCRHHWYVAILLCLLLTGTTASNGASTLVQTPFEGCNFLLRQVSGAQVLTAGSSHEWRVIGCPSREGGRGNLPPTRQS